MGSIKLERNNTKDDKSYKKSGKDSKQGVMGINVHGCQDRKRIMNNNDH